MSIKISREKCRGCRRCGEVCPGNLIDQRDGKADISYPRDCWGCTACLKECRFGAIRLFLGPDIGGKGTQLYAIENKDCLEWHFVSPTGSERVIAVNKGESNQY